MAIFISINFIIVIFTTIIIAILIANITPIFIVVMAIEIVIVITIAIDIDVKFNLAIIIPIFKPIITDSVSAVVAKSIRFPIDVNIVNLIFTIFKITMIIKTIMIIMIAITIIMVIAFNLNMELVSNVILNLSQILTLHRVPFLIHILNIYTSNYFIVTFNKFCPPIQIKYYKLKCKNFIKNPQEVLSHTH